MHRLWLALGALAGLGAVALSAWAAHGLPHRLPAPALASVQSAITMQGWHALALLATVAWNGFLLWQVATLVFGWMGF